MSETSKAASKKPRKVAAVADNLKKGIVISFRVSESDFEPYADPISKSGMTRSAFFYKLFIESKDRIVIAEKKTATKDYSSYLFIVNKVSNNINQLARSFNSAEKAGLITGVSYLKGLNTLNSIMLILKGKLGRDN